jgi:thymidylate synthase
MNNLDKSYQSLLQDIIDNGVEKKDRTGTGTISVFGRQIRHKMSDGFPLLTTKKMAFKTMVTELLWFLRGDTNIKFLVDNNCHIWDGDAYKRYSIISGMSTQVESLTQEEFINKIKTDDEFAKKWGDLGPVYGAQWRSWSRNATRDEKIIDPGVYTKQIDQISILINDLKTNPDSRRLMVSAWNVGELDKMTLPPCHYGFQVYTRELSLEERLCIADKFNPLIREDCLTKTHHPDETEELKLVYRHEFLDSLGPNVVPQRRAISLMWNQRSVDTFLGLPFNIASYGLLLEIIAKEVNMVPDELIGNLGDVHLYSNHIDQAREQIGVPLNHEKRNELLKEAMGVEAYERAVSELVPFGGGLSEHYSSCKIPYSTRDPFPLPTLKIYSLDLDDIAHHEIGDFEIQNYQSHPSIKGELSN